MREGGVEIERADGEYAVLMVSPENTDADFERLLAILAKIPQREALVLGAPPALCKGEAKMSIREAMLARSELVPVSEAIGRICASPTVSCPPAIPIVISGEVITEASVRLLRYYGMSTLRVVREG